MSTPNDYQYFDSQHFHGKSIFGMSYGRKYSENDNQALETLNLQTVSDRRKMLARQFPEKCTYRFNDLFPLNDNHIGARN